mmetsp:Transcript_13572/g.21186  ORF Transcript_13572/g.21186 Transcript_13572/m.21186 type:complete len:89 (+) Transcript_13572:1790-2056(+)
MANEIKANSHMRYVKYLKKPINKELDHDLIMKNKKSTYRQMFFEEKAGPKSPRGGQQDSGLGSRLGYLSKANANIINNDGIKAVNLKD